MFVAELNSSCFLRLISGEEQPNDENRSVVCSRQQFPVQLHVPLPIRNHQVRDEQASANTEAPPGESNDEEPETCRRPVRERHRLRAATKSRQGGRHQSRKDGSRQTEVSTSCGKCAVAGEGWGFSFFQGRASYGAWFVEQFWDAKANQDSGVLFSPAMP